VWEALIPPQPAAKSSNATRGAHRRNVLMGLMVGNCISEGLFGNLIMKTRPKLEVAKNLEGKDAGLRRPRPRSSGRKGSPAHIHA
jgi:hypothetical protein